MDSGFQRRTFRLEFDDPSWNGFVVRCSSMTIDALLEFERLAINTDWRELASEDDEVKAQRWEDKADLESMLSRHIKSWNLLDDDGKPVPHTAAQLSQEEWPMVKAICSALYNAVVRVPPPLSQPSSDGLPLKDIEIPMETLSPSQPSSSEQKEPSDYAYD